jgi:hypothetical protein
MNDSTRFRSPEHAVRFAFAVEGRPVVDISPFFRDLRGGSVKLPEEVTGESSGWDRAAQGAMIVALMLRHLSKDQQAVLVARYTKPISPQMEREKRRLLGHVLNLIRPQLPRVKLYYLVDVVRGWGGFRREHDDRWWAVHYRVEDRTLRNWSHGRHYRGQHVTGIMDVLESLEQECYQTLLEPMVDAGLVPETQEQDSFKLLRRIKK